MKELPEMRDGGDVTNELEPLRALSAAAMAFARGRAASRAERHP